MSTQKTEKRNTKASMETLEKASMEASAEGSADISLEDAFAKLEETVADLEREDISLEESFMVYQKGMELLKKCNQAIDRIEKKVLVLEEDGETHEF